MEIIDKQVNQVSKTTSKKMKDTWKHKIAAKYISYPEFFSLTPIILGKKVSLYNSNDKKWYSTIQTQNWETKKIVHTDSWLNKCNKLL